ncbi:MAG: GNAT family N-acetyltransferase [Desulfosarcinaceae bacterium]
MDHNPIVEFQPVDKVFDQLNIGANPGFVAVISARKVDLTGRIALHTGRANVASGPGEVLAIVNGAQISEGGFTVFGLPSRDERGETNIALSIEGMRNRLDFREAVDCVVSEFGVASLKGLTLRERALALIEIAHPEDRAGLVAAAKKENLLYRDQIYLAESARCYPAHINEHLRLKNGIELRFRPIRPSDEEGMRRLFYRFSDKAVYDRYFTPVRVMPHTRMQTYVNVDWTSIMAIVGVVGKPGEGRLVAEARYLLDSTEKWAEVAFVVDEAYQNLGISTAAFKLLVRLAGERGLKGFWADVLTSNTAMLKVFEKAGLPVTKTLEGGVYHLTIPLI